MKKSMLICAPVTSRSGYGAHARDLIFSLLQNDNLNIKILDVPWGDTPRNALEEENNKKFLEYVLPPGVQINSQPDIYVDIRIPNEFMQVGKYNIGITAGIETTAVSQKWIEGCNKMDLIIVPSEHSKDGFLTSTFEKIKQLPDGKTESMGTLTMDTDIEVLFEGADEDIYKPLKKDEMDSKLFDWLNEKVPERFAFLFVGQWGKGNYGEDRKDIGTMIKTFYESFANKKKQPALILKTNGATYSVMDKEDCLTKNKHVKSQFQKDWKLPNVYLLHGSHTDAEMNELYNHPKIKSMVSFTHGEGFGRPLLEATMTGLPVVASGWSGQIDFLDKELCLLCPGELREVPKSAVWKDIIIPESKWFYIDTNVAYKAFNMHVSDNNLYQKKAKKLMDINRKKFTLNKMSKELIEVVDKYTKDLPTQTKLNLPKLKKVESTSSLPKLKKVKGKQ